MRKTRYKYFLVIVTWVLIALPMIFQPLHFIKVKQLKGYFPIPADSSLNLENWMSGDFQRTNEESLKFKLRLRPDFVRLYNQIRYSLFSEISALNVFKGKNGYLYEGHYITASLGYDFIGENEIINKVSSLKRVVDSLNSNGVKFLFVLAPGKGYVFPEYLPAKFDNWEHRQTNYEAFRKYLKQNNIPLIDFNSWFREIKDSTQYPIYAKGGTHWSIYGTYLAFDSIVTRIELALQKDLPDYKYPKYMVKSKPLMTDDDIEKAANLMWYNHSEKLLYPVLTITDTNGKFYPNVLTIADSYYWTMVNCGLQKLFFKDFNFWYYYKENHTSNNNEPKYVQEYKNLKEEIEKRDIIIFMITDGNLPKFSWDFVEGMNEIYGIE